MKPAYLFCLLTAGCVFRAALGTELRIPAATAYIEPDPTSLRVSESTGSIRGWTDPGQSISWFGQFTNTGALNCAVVVRAPSGTHSTLKLSVAGQAVERGITGTAEDVTVDFGKFQLTEPGYQRLRLESLNTKGENAGEVKALLLSGEAAQGAHFNLKPRRNAASVHLFYPEAKEHTNVQAFYCEVTAVEDPVWTFYMACGWHRGYFGMQVNSPTERRIIFSVWDSGDEAVDRGKVQSENRVTLVAKGEGVYSGDFGNEGTGGHSHLKYVWRTGDPQRFVVTARPSGPAHTIYSGYYFHPGNASWMLISSWRAPKEGGYMRGLHSFSENFGGDNGQLLRKARFGNQWMQLATGEWLELTRAGFSHDPTGKADRLDRFMGIERGQFFLSHGGFVPGYTKYGEVFSRAATAKAPSDLQLPPLPDAH